MAGQKIRKMVAPIRLSVFLEANEIVRLERQALAISKKTGYKVYRSDVVREIITHYLNVSGI